MVSHVLLNSLDDGAKVISGFRVATEVGQVPSLFDIGADGLQYCAGHYILTTHRTDCI